MAPRHPTPFADLQPLFNELWSRASNDRINASITLLNKLHSVQKDFQPTTQHDVSKGKGKAKDYESELSQDHSPEFVYTLKRFCGGITSSRDASRLGFGTALSEVICLLIYI